MSNTESTTAESTTAEAAESAESTTVEHSSADYDNLLSNFWPERTEVSHFGAWSVWE